MEVPSDPETGASRRRWVCQVFLLSAVLIYLLTYVCVRFLYRQMDLVPEVVEFEGFVNYGSPITSPASEGGSGGSSA